MITASCQRSTAGSLRGAPLLLLGLLVLAAGRASAQAPRGPGAPGPGTSALTVEHLGRGRIRIKRGKAALRLDLGPDFAGCKGEMYDPMEKQRWQAAVSIEVVDETASPPFDYLVLLAQAAANCNIQGACGASRGESTLIWLKLTRDLALAGKQAILFDSCDVGRWALIEGGEGGAGTEEGFSAKDLRWTGGVLQIDVETDIDDPPKKNWRLTYDRRQPEAGLSWLQEDALRPKD
ncbi:MAG TPA: hypothetical protein VKY89_15240 [Thermoanaerobaculia bacterium]|jgi:hypothetical protein|nr:hypothetical protein [Thermoanaerobaculia bacterium]